MIPIPYITFHGNCADALAEYARIFDAAPANVMTFSEAPQEMRESIPEASPQAVMHAALKIGEGWIYASDDIMGGSPEMAGCSITIDLPDVTRARAVFDALAESGQIHMEFTKTFWSEGFGTLTDRFGTRWMIGVEVPMPEQAPA
ncbi:VOC family protein [Limimaricola litoreus]|uniref:Glyoxalase/bleomycin resistance/extradiol dioxygenase family protein n=1 Tax=Limimaricola litoreus TaxID=2955316 RepID=A0A9X2FPE5_9RHOB|nr:glyoxalase/bleomycin resistance/extradiol dioxygenase family protein [Limimaricola litoreus]MCP1168662.1 glyoxalase/bleomycin resistance/extradiol dioxygenase family protein [Limimaricola litoreus]